MKVEKGRRVRIKVRLAVVDGDEIEKSVVEYFQGGGSMLPGLEAEVDGLAAGAKKKGVIKADHAFGDERFHVKKKISRKEFPKDTKFEKGMQFAAKDADKKQDVVLRVLGSDDDNVEVEMLHPLADKDIEYEFEVLNVTDPTPPPIPIGALLSDDDLEDDEAEAD